MAAFFNIFTCSVITAMNITKFSALFFSGAGMFFLIKEFYSEKVALLTAAFYIIFPYNAFQFYFVGTFASTVSFMWFAPILLFTYKYMKDRLYRYILYAGASYSGLILTHPINAYMFTIVLVAFIIYMTIAKRRITLLLSIPLIIVTGLSISAAYVLPFIYEKQFLNMRFFVGEGGGFGFNFHNFYILPNMTDKFSPGQLWPAFYNTFVIFIFFFSILILVHLRRRIRLNHAGTTEDVGAVNKFFFGTAVCSIFLLFGISRFIWETIPFFEYIQFPVRWLNITAFAVVFLSAVIFRVPDNRNRTRMNYIFFIGFLVLSCLLLDFRYISSAHVFTRQDLEPVKAANWNLEHMPLWVGVEKIDRTDDYKERVTIIKGKGKAEVVVWRSADRIIEIKADDPVTLRIRTFYFPGWKAHIDDVQTEIRPEEGTGAMLIAIPEGDHTLVLRFEDTPVRYYAKIISVISFFITVLLVLIPKKTNRTSITGI